MATRGGGVVVVVVVMVVVLVLVIVVCGVAAGGGAGAGGVGGGAGCGCDLPEPPADRPQGVERRVLHQAARHLHPHQQGEVLEEPRVEGWLQAQKVGQLQAHQPGALLLQGHSAQGNF